MANTIITQNGELIDYCSSISNTGSDPCFNTIGLFNLPTGLSVDSVLSVSTGVYDPVSGLWQIGQIDGAVESVTQTETICLKLRVDDIDAAPFLVTTTYSSSCTEDPIDNVSACVYDILHPTITPTVTSTPTITSTNTPTSTPTGTPTGTVTSTPTITPTVTPTMTPTVTVTETKGACCISGNCICTDAVGCATIGGTFMGVGTQCNTTVCEQSSCFDNVCDARIQKTKRYDLPNYTTPTSTFTISLGIGEELVEIIMVSANGTTRQEGIGVYDYKVTGNVVEFNTRLAGSGPNPCYGQILYTVDCSLGLELGCDCPITVVPTPTPTVTGTPIASLVLTKTSVAVANPEAELTLVKTSTVTANPEASLTLSKTSTVIANSVADLTLTKTSTVQANPTAALFLDKSSSVTVNQMAEISLAKSSDVITAPAASIEIEKVSTTTPSSLQRQSTNKAKPTRKRKAGRPKGSKDKVKRKSRTKK